MCYLFYELCASRVPMTEKSLTSWVNERIALTQSFLTQPWNWFPGIASTFWHWFCLRRPRTEQTPSPKDAFLTWKQPSDPSEYFSLREPWPVLSAFFPVSQPSLSTLLATLLLATFWIAHIPLERWRLQLNAYHSLPFWQLLLFN